MKKRTTISDAVAYHNFTIAFGQFLDDFKQASYDEKYKLIRDEPKHDNINKAILCHAAAAVHKLSNDNGIDTPSWVFNPVYIMPEPYYAHNVQSVDFQQYLFETSPPEYATRNIYFGDNVLLRV